MSGISRITPQGYDYPNKAYNPFWENESGVETDYELLENKPRINGVTLIGNKTSEDLNIEECEQLTSEQMDNIVEEL